MNQRTAGNNNRTSGENIGCLSFGSGDLRTIRRVEIFNKQCSRLERQSHVGLGNREGGVVNLESDGSLVGRIALWISSDDDALFEYI